MMMNVLPILLGTAWAQDVPALNAHLYRPPIDAEKTLWTDDAFTAPDGYYQARVGFNYSRKPLVFVYEDGEVVGLLENVVQMNILGGYVYKQIRFGLDLPVFLLANGDAGAGTGLGDVALDVKGTILRADMYPVGLAVGGRLGLPTSTSVAPVGNPGASGELQAIASQNVGPVAVSANLGTRFLPETALDNVAWDDQFFYRLGGGYEIVEGAGASMDLAGQFTYGEPLNNPASSPVELLFGGWYRVFDDYVVRAGAGSGLNSGVGSPNARVVLGVSYEPVKIFDRDLDTIVDADDVCPDDPEDFDEYKDTDGCPDPSTPVYFEVVDNNGEFVYDVLTKVRTEFGPEEGNSSAFDLQIHPGEYVFEARAERYVSKSFIITVPDAPRHEVRVVMQPTFGTILLTVLGPDGESLGGRANVGPDRCRLELGQCELLVSAGSGMLQVRSEGFKTHQVEVAVQAGLTQEITVTMASARAVVTREKIEILEKVYFDTAKTTIKEESFPLLNEVASVLQEYPDIQSIRVEGHTDSRGRASYNLRLSQGRAEAVRQYLIEQGIDPARLVSEGFGEDSPIEAASTMEAYEQNRRVEFVILEREGGNGE
jgi:outer membrane protein OmpA-like peptidoglycan-associated protein